VRKPALDPANRIGSLFLNPGGPGGSGVEFVRTAPPEAFAAVARFDVVGFDPRGVGASRPAIDCGLPQSAAEFVFVQRRPGGVGTGQGLTVDYLDLNASGQGNDAQIAVLGVDQRFDRKVDQYFSNGEHNYGLFDHFWWDGGYSDLLQAVWPVEDRGAFRGELENPAGANPIMVIGVTYDPATPFIGAERLTTDLGNARLLTYQGDGHGALRTFDPCLWAPFVGYLNDLVLPPEGATCVDQRPRFPSDAGLTTTSTTTEAWLIDEPRLPL
jgi:pimeloyl-ACP methyl ester carboxylesterase